MPVQDNFIFAQPGIQTKVKALKDLISRIDGLWEMYICLTDVIF